MKKLRVSHFPQIPCKPFTVDVESPQEAKKIMDILADYDQFQLDNRIKPDYANMSVFEYWDEEEQDWLNWYDEDTGLELDEYLEMLEEKAQEVSIQHAVLGVEQEKLSEIVDAQCVKLEEGLKQDVKEMNG